MTDNNSFSYGLQITHEKTLVCGLLSLYVMRTHKGNLLLLY